MKKILKPRQQSKIKVLQSVDGTVWLNKDGIWTDKPYLKRINKHTK
jgi:hypothetical protein